MPDEFTVTRADALEVCLDILEWRATEAQWETIAKLVDVLGDAVLADNWPQPRERVAKTIAELEKSRNRQPDRTDDGQSGRR